MSTNISMEESEGTAEKAPGTQEESRKLFACLLLPHLNGNKVQRLEQEYQQNKDGGSTLYSKQETQRKRRSSRRFSCDTDKSVNHFCNTISSAFFSTHSRQMRRLRLDSAVKLPCWRLVWTWTGRQNTTKWEKGWQNWPRVFSTVWTPSCNYSNYLRVQQEATRSRYWGSSRGSCYCHGNSLADEAVSLAFSIFTRAARGCTLRTAWPTPLAVGL